MDLNSDDFEYVKEDNWATVLEIWKQHENNDHYHFTFDKEQHNSWLDWRMGMIDQLQLSEMSWKKYKILNPSTTVPKFYGGPFKDWIERYYDDNFSDKLEVVAKNHFDEMTSRSFYKEINEHKPQVDILALGFENRIYVIEGMHRSMTICLNNLKGLENNFEVTLYFAQPDLESFGTIPLRELWDDSKN